LQPRGPKQKQNAEKRTRDRQIKKKRDKNTLKDGEYRRGEKGDANGATELQGIRKIRETP